MSAQGAGAGEPSDRDRFELVQPDEGARATERVRDLRAIVAGREDAIANAAAALGFVAGGGIGGALGLPPRGVGLGRRTSAWKGMRMRNRRLDAQLAPAMMSLAATNQQLLGLVGYRRGGLLTRLGLMGVVAGGIALATAEPEQRKALLDQGQALLEQGQAVLASSGVLDKFFGS